MTKANAHYRRVESQFAFFHNMTIQDFTQYCIERMAKQGRHPKDCAHALYDALADMARLSPHIKE